MGCSVNTALTTVGDLLERVFAVVGSMPEARWILQANATVQGWAQGQGDLWSRLDVEVPASVERGVDEMVRRRQAGEPLQYVIGTWEFRSLEVRVDRRVLIPRPETETVVGCALEELAALAARDRGRDQLIAADLGTGSGVIALSLAVEGPFHDGSTWIWATDSSAGALSVARDNLALAESRHGVPSGCVRLARGEWFEALPTELNGSIGLIVSNPPYVSESEWVGLDHEVRDFEPRSALVAGESGLEALELLVREAPRWLSPGGSIVLELAPHQADPMSLMAQAVGFVDVRVRPDLAGRPRVLIGCLP